VNAIDLILSLWPSLSAEDKQTIIGRLEAETGVKVPVASPCEKAGHRFPNRPFTVRPKTAVSRELHLFRCGRCGKVAVQEV
jgi:hypothetical protein